MSPIEARNRDGWEEDQAVSWSKFVARQPILNAGKNVVGFELLFRSGLENHLLTSSSDHASSSVMVTSCLLCGMQSLTGGRKAFINFTENLLAREYATFLPVDQTVIEILEDVRPAAVEDACKALKKRGYTIALDDFPCDGRMAPLIPYADIVKVDWIATPPEIRRRLPEVLIPKGIQLLAEKIETHEQYHEALKMGYTHFQGFFFCKPEIVTGRDIPALQSNHLRLLSEINKEEPNLRAVEQIIMQEPSLCYKLLRYLNSAAFCFRGNIASVRHALLLLGNMEVRKWISVVTIADMGEKKADTLVATSVMRARFCESLGGACLLSRHTSELFLMGLFSLIDAILDKPMEKILRDLPISNEIRDTLLEKETRFRTIYRLIRAYEKSDWEEASGAASALGLSEETVVGAYTEAARWTQKMT